LTIDLTFDLLTVFWIFGSLPFMILEKGRNFLPAVFLQGISCKMLKKPKQKPKKNDTFLA